MWLNVIQLSKLEEFEYLPSQLSMNEKPWRWWYQRPAPEAEELPDRFENLDTFRKTLIIRSLCPDRLVLQAQKYVKSSLGKKFTEAVILNLEELYEESRPRTPMICFLTMGADPTTAIEALAKKLEFHLGAISMGQGQEVIARVMVKHSMEEGKWVLLQNCHLAISYMHEVFETITTAKHVDDGFRLWITTEPNVKFPISILHISFKFTNDPPQGLKAGITRTYMNMAQEMLEYTNAKPYLPLVFGISFLHSIVQERRRFGPIGWNIPYEFNFSDWYASIMFCQNHLDSKERVAGVDWLCLRYMLAEVMYGGRVTDDYDKRLLINFCNLWFSDEMLEEGFYFHKGYPLLKNRNKDEYLEDIGKLQEFDDPYVFGLHPNAYITLRTNMTMEVLDSILSVQPKESGGGGGESRESVVARETKEMLSKLPDEYNPHEVKARLKEMGALNSLNIFLRQEIDRMQKVIKLVKITLKDMLLAIEGIIIMNEGLREAFDAIYDAKVPHMWKRGSWESASLGFWYTELLTRNKQFVKWCFKGRPTCFWMTGFFNPQGFLTAMKQEVARAHKGWALDAVFLENKVTKFTGSTVLTGPKEGVYVYGLYLDGCSWDKKQDRLVESTPKVIYCEMPMVWIFAINTNEPRPKDVYTCPVYKKPRRTDLNFITPLWLPCKFTSEHWILRGVALLCDIK